MLYYTAKYSQLNFMECVFFLLQNVSFDFCQSAGVIADECQLFCLFFGTIYSTKH